ncbi:MAG: hypothetical protein V5A20_06275 [Salinibacter sp.]|uniref:hypothetical protein n=1 Tax=Salinibacter sp. TaxID=2065818 RepID=UPI002FC32675
MRDLFSFLDLHPAMSVVSAKPAQNRNSSDEAVYRTSWRQRALSTLAATIMLLLVGPELTSGDPLWTWDQLMDVVLLGAVLLGGAHGFLAKIEISDRTLWKRRPLWTDKDLRLSTVERVHFPTTQSGLWLYTDPDGDPALTVQGQFERFGQLAIQVADQLPGTAEITDPAGRLDKYRREYGDAGE